MESTNPLFLKVASLPQDGNVQNHVASMATKEQSSLEPDEAPETAVVVEQNNTHQVSACDEAAASIAGTNKSQENCFEHTEQPRDESSSLLQQWTSLPQPQHGTSHPIPDVVAGSQQVHDRDGESTHPTHFQTITPGSSGSHRDKRICTGPVPATLPQPRGSPSQVFPRATSFAESTPQPQQPQSTSMSSEGTATSPLSRLAGSLETWKLGMPAPVQMRVCQLQDSCVLPDFQFLAIHQIYAIKTRMPALLQHLNGFGPPHERGLDILGEMLRQNATLPPDFVAKSAVFPVPLERALSQKLHYARHFPYAMRALTALSLNWHEFERRIVARRIPPLVDEVRCQFWIYSPVLWNIIFTFCYRRMKGSQPDKRWDRYARIYLEDHRFGRVRLRGSRLDPIMIDQIKAHNGRVLNAYNHVVQEEYSEGHMGLPHPPVQLALSDLMLTPLPQQTQNQPTRLTPEGNAVQQLNHTAIMSPSKPYTQRPSLVAQQPPYQVPMPVQTNMPPSNGPAPTIVTGIGQAPTQQASLQPPPQLNTGRCIQYVPMTQSSHFQQSGPSPFIPHAYNTQDRAQWHGTQIVRYQPPNGPTMAVHNLHAAATPAVPQPLSRGAYPQPFAWSLTPSFPPSTSALHPTSQLLFPPPGTPVSVPANPDPLLSGLHEAHLMVITKTLDQNGKEDPSRRLYQFFHSFAIPPQCLGVQASTFRWELILQSTDSNRLAMVLPPQKDSPLTYGVMDGSLSFQLRCARIKTVSEPLPEEKWIAMDCNWPQAIYLHVNGIEHHISRKIHHGKDLPINITSSLREGTNDISITYLRGPNEYTSEFYAVAVEKLETAEHERVRNSVETLPVSASVERILQRLKRTSLDDDELCFVDEYVSVNLVDPFMARIVDIPVRGKSCSHPDCFDLETYLSTRLSKTVRGNGMAEAWKCPICRGDTRPANMIIDEFLLSVRTELEKRNQLSTVKTILVKQDGTWEAKKEKESEQKSKSQTPALPKLDGSQTGNPASQNPPPAPSLSSLSRPAKQPEVIELD
ncbi:hypothetical protein VTO42DRAFT_4509 [Malbranchea cinnamomea]